MDDQSKQLDGLIDKRFRDRIDDYIGRGRRLAGRDDVYLRHAWIGAIKMWKAKLADAVNHELREDLQSEMLLRGYQPPFELVREELEILRNAREDLVPRLRNTDIKAETQRVDKDTIEIPRTAKVDIKADSGQADICQADIAKADIAKADLGKADIGTADLGADVRTQRVAQRAAVAATGITLASITKALMPNAPTASIPTAKIPMPSAPVPSAQVSNTPTSDLLMSDLPIKKSDVREQVVKLIGKNVGKNVGRGIDNFRDSFKRKSKS
jgi:hypothetical protein